jgi:thioredoxin
VRLTPARTPPISRLRVLLYTEKCGTRHGEGRANGRLLSRLRRHPTRSSAPGVLLIELEFPMNRGIVVFLTLLLALAVAAGCGKKRSQEQQGGTNTEQAERGATEDRAEAQEEDSAPGAMKPETQHGELMTQLTKETFPQKVFDYRQQEAEFQGDLPCIIDFYADWCGPCKQLEPILRELAGEYKGKINVYRVDVDDERELAMSFGIRGIPALLLVPMEGEPRMLVGLQPKEKLEEAIAEVRKVE